MKKLACSLLFALGLLLPLAAQQPRLQMDVSSLAARASQTSDVTLDGAALKLGMAFLKAGDLSPEDRQALSKLQGIYVKSFDFAHAAAPKLTDPALAALHQQLQGPGWTRIVSVQQRGKKSEDHETDEIYLCTAANGNILGMAILSRQPDELDLVNIVGDISPQELTKLGGNLGIPKIQPGK